MAAQCPRYLAVLRGSSSGSARFAGGVGTLGPEPSLSVGAAACASAPRFIERATTPQDCKIFSTLPVPSAASRPPAAIFATSFFTMAAPTPTITTQRAALRASALNVFGKAPSRQWERCGHSGAR
ncbi:hypothetical protein TRVL_08195 [Trypanosoma vivax]|nr:hypothetical protein TRVL_08195 [Trypanosoma vivax]